MKRVSAFITRALLTGLLVIVPIYLATLLLLKGMSSIAGESRENVWKPALFESGEGLVPAFIIEELADRRYTVFVPSIPTPFAGAVYVLDASRVHALDIPFSEALKTVSRWGSGARDLVAAMEKGKSAPITEPAPGAGVTPKS